MACLVNWARQGAKAAAASCLSLALATSASAQLPVTDGLQLWLDASDPATLFQDTAMTIPSLDGDRIGIWLDKSGNDFHATAVGDPNVEDQRPVRDMEMNGMPAAHFSSSDAGDGSRDLGDGMLVDAGLQLGRPYTVFVVNQYHGTTGNDIRQRTLQGTDGANWLHGLWGSNVAHYAEGWVSANAAAENGLVYIADATGAPDGSTFYVNGEDRTDSTAPTGIPNGLALGGGAGQFSAEMSDADISEVIVYNRVLSGAELTQVRDSLYAKYDIANDTALGDPDPLPPQPENVALRGTLGTFTGGDAGEGLDLSGTFAHAVNVGGAEIAVGGLTFTDGSEAGMAGGSSPGVTITDANEIPTWNAGDEYGDSDADNAMETVMASIRWNVPPGLDIDLAVDPGQLYKLQLLFAEAGGNPRGWDISVEGELSIDNFEVIELQETSGLARDNVGAVFTQIVSSDDDVLSIVMGGFNPEAADHNPILQGVTLEVVPEPSTWVLLGLGSLAFLAVIRRRN